MSNYEEQLREVIAKKKFNLEECKKIVDTINEFNDEESFKVLVDSQGLKNNEDFKTWIKSQVNSYGGYRFLDWQIAELELDFEFVKCLELRTKNDTVEWINTHNLLHFKKSARVKLAEKEQIKQNSKQLIEKAISKEEDIEAGVGEWNMAVMEIKGLKEALILIDEALNKRSDEVSKLGLLLE